MLRTCQVISALISTLLSLIVATALISPLHAQQKPEQLAQQSSDAWLALVDSGKYANSWDEAAQYFKNAVTKEQWGKASSTRSATRWGKCCRES